MPRITGMRVHDVRFPTSDELHGSDAMHPDPDYSAAYVVLDTNDGVPGFALSFTIGRGTEVVCACIEAFRARVVGVDLDDVADDPSRFWRRIASDSQLRWLGPEKGVVHLATSAIVNAVWDVLARREGKPLWRYLVDLAPEQIVRAIDFRHITDALTPDEAIDILRAARPGRDEREAQLRAEGYPAYTTSAGWIGYPDDRVAELAGASVLGGWNAVKMKVGQNAADDFRRARIIRDVIGPERRLMMDANQVWDVPEAIAWMRPLAVFDPLWIEEPTNPDDVLGHARIRQAVAPIGVATGEHCANRVLFKQLFQAGAIDFCQVDACRLGGVNEVLPVLLMAAKFGVPVCPHAGGVGLCEMVRHYSVFDYLCVSASLEKRMTEYSAHLHEHFVDPAVVRAGRYVVPEAPGFSTQMHADAVAEYGFPDGPVWKER